jgi:hypothetical protein
MLERIGEIQIADLRNWAITVLLQQFGYLTTESLVFKEQTTYVTGLFISNQQETSVSRPGLRQQHHSKNPDFAYRVFVFRSVDPSPSGRPVAKPVVRHQWMVSKLHLLS